MSLNLCVAYDNANVPQQNLCSSDYELNIRFPDD